MLGYAGSGFVSSVIGSASNEGLKRIGLRKLVQKCYLV